MFVCHVFFKNAQQGSDFKNHARSNIVTAFPSDHEKRSRI